MNKNTAYLAVFAVLCVLAGVLVGANITRRPNLPWSGPKRPSFRERAERFMGYEPRHVRGRKGRGGLIEVLTAKLDLSQEQKAKVTEILEKTRQEIDEVGKNVRGAIAEIKEKGDRQIMDILTPQQQEKFKELQKEFKTGRRPRQLGERRVSTRKHRPHPDERFQPHEG